MRKVRNFSMYTLDSRLKVIYTQLVITSKVVNQKSFVLDLCEGTTIKLLDYFVQFLSLNTLIKLIKYLKNMKK